MKTNTTAANEAAKNNAIYNELATIARRVFNHINGAEEGKKYTPADIARAITGGPVVTCVNGLNYRCDRVEPYQLGAGLSWCEGFDPETAYNVAVDGFSCRVIAWKIFNVLDNAARSLDIPAAARVTFERPRAAAPVVASFSLSTTAARELAACCADDKLRPVMEGVHLDTRRRVLVASDGHVLRVVQLGAALTVDESAAAPSYIIPAAVIKSGRVVTIDANDIAATDKKSAPCIAGHYPNWAGVVPAVSDAGRVSLTADQWKNLKKAVATAAAVHPKTKYGNGRRVVIAHEFMSDVLHVWAYNYDFNLEKDITIPVDNVREEFSISFNADDFTRIGGNVTALYLHDNSRAIVTTDAAGLSLVMPKLQPDDEEEKYCFRFNFSDGAVDVLPGVNLSAAAREIAEENEHAAALEIVAKVREECEGKSTAKMLKYMDDKFGYSKCLDRARQMLRDEIAAETAAANESTNESTAAPAADQTTDADTMSDRENEHNDNESAPALTLPPLAALLTSNDAPALSLTLPTPSPRPVLLLPVLTSEESTNDADADEMTADTITNDESTTPAPWSSPFATLPELPDMNTNDESDGPAVVIAANFARRARRWFHVAAAVLAVLIITAAPVAITTDESTTPARELLTIGDTITNETPAPAADVFEPVSDETTAAPADDKTTAPDTVSARENKRETPRPRRHHRRAIVAAPDTLAAPLLTITPDTLTADTMSARAIVADTLQAARNITETADTLTAAPAADIESDTDDETPAPVLTITDESDDDTAAPADETSDDESETSTTGTTTTGNGGTTGTTTTTAPASVVIVGASSVPVWLLTL